DHRQRSAPKLVGGGGFVGQAGGAIGRRDQWGSIVDIDRTGRDGSVGLRMPIHGFPLIVRVNSASRSRRRPHAGDAGAVQPGGPGPGDAPAQVITDADASRVRSDAGRVGVWSRSPSSRLPYLWTPSQA